MVPNLPYFMVQFDHKGEKGYGHVIEGSDKRDDEDAMEEGEKGGGDFPRCVAHHHYLSEALTTISTVTLRERSLGTSSSWRRVAGGDPGE
jgi:Protein similar to CwfJ C-terminus 2